MVYTFSKIVGSRVHFLQVIALGQHIEAYQIGQGIAIEIGYIAAHGKERGVVEALAQFFLEGAIF
jgi:hypothetical protein